MRHIITINATKGGCGKSTTSSSLALAAARDGKRVLCVDLDPQASLSFILDADPDIPTAYSIFSGGDPEKAIQATEYGVDLIAATDDLLDVKTFSGSIYRLSEALEKVKRRYDVIIIDNEPGAGELVNNSLMAAGEVLIPLETDILSINGFYTIVDIIRQIRQTKRNLRYSGVLVCMYDGRTVANRQLREMIEEYATENHIPYLGEIRRCTKVREALATGNSLFNYAPKCTAALDYLSLYEKIMEE